MSKVYNITAFAKVNLFLRVCGKYENGYHRLLMLMQEVDLCDEIELSFDNGKEFGIELVNNIEGLDVTKNLCFKAADRFYDKVLRKRCLAGEEIDDIKKDFEYTSIKTVKNIPSEAGLGGGSSDAASILMTLSQHYSNPLTFEELVDLAATLGADVPFFLTGGSCFCEGIGEIVTEVPSLAGMDMILVKPSEGVPTGKCFNLCDEYPEDFDEDEYRNKMTEIFMDDSILPIDRISRAADLLTNDLQRAAVEITPRVSEILKKVEATNPVFVMMSGSGSTVFGIYKDALDSDRALEILKADKTLEDSKIIKTLTI